MTQEQAEANWVWDPKCGDLWPKEWPKGGRPRPTPQNIRAQRRLARPGKLIHWSAAEVNKKLCLRFNAGVDAVPILGSKTGEKSKLGARFISNVNCLECRRRYFSR